MWQLKELFEEMGNRIDGEIEAVCIRKFDGGRQLLGSSTRPGWDPNTFDYVTSYQFPLARDWLIWFINGLLNAVIGVRSTLWMGKRHLKQTSGVSYPHINISFTLYPNRLNDDNT